LRYGSGTSQLTYQSGASANSVTTVLAFRQKAIYETDISVGYQLTERLHMGAGAQNLFNKFPNKVPEIARRYGQNIYDETFQGIGIVGGNYYAKINYSF
jgi:iron complex outermembrane receptor protein